MVNFGQDFNCRRQDKEFVSKDPEVTHFLIVMAVSSLITTFMVSLIQ